MTENILYYSGIALVLVAALWIGTVRDRRTEAAIRKFAMLHGLSFRPGALLKGAGPEASGQYNGWPIFIGLVFVNKFTKGIGRAETESQLEARLDLPDGTVIDPIRIAPFLQGGGGFKGRSLRLFFPKRYLHPLKYEEIEAAFAQLKTTAENALNPTTKRL